MISENFYAPSFLRDMFETIMKTCWKLMEEIMNAHLQR